jgi:hypothetical protein
VNSFLQGNPNPHVYFSINANQLSVGSSIDAIPTVGPYEMFFFLFALLYRWPFIAEVMQDLCDRLKFLGKVLSVERATPASSKDGLSAGSSMTTTADEGTGTAPPPPPPVPQPGEGFQTGRVASGGEPIAPSLGVDYPFPPQLEYVQIRSLQVDITVRSGRSVF